MSYSVYPRMHSIYGRKFGITEDGHPVTETGYMDNVTAYTSASTATNLKYYGVNTLDVSTGSSSSGCSFILDYPRPGIAVTIANVTTSSTQAITIQTTAGTFFTGTQTIMGSSVSFATPISAGSSWNTITLNAGGEALEFVGLSTSYYMLKSANGFSTGDTVFSVT